MRTRVLGLGNTILRDDGVGIHVARAVAARLDGTAAGVDVVEAETAGFALLELLENTDRAVVVDAVSLDGLAPGQIVRMDLARLRPSLRLSSVHEIDLPTAIALGTRLGRRMPSDVTIVGIQADDLYTLGENLTPAVAAAVPRAVETVLEIVREPPSTPARGGPSP